MSRVRKTESEKKDPMNKSARTFLRNMDMFFFFGRWYYTFGSLV